MFTSMFGVFFAAFIDVMQHFYKRHCRQFQLVQQNETNHNVCCIISLFRTCMYIM